MRELCTRKGIEIIEAELCPDHVHILVEIAPKYSVSQITWYLKGKSALIIFDRHANLKYKYGNRKFWCRGYYVDSVGRNEKKIKEYIFISLYIIMEFVASHGLGFAKNYPMLSLRWFWFSICPNGGNFQK